MAVSSTIATVYIVGKNIPVLKSKNGTMLSHSTISFPVKQRRFYIRSSGDVSTETTSAEVDSESSIEVPKGPPSLISALNVERALRGIPITDADHYSRLGISRGSPLDQVTVAYSNKVEELKNQELEEEELQNKLELLKESYTILSSEEERRIYDWSLARSEKPDAYVWPFEVDITQTPKDIGTPPPQEPEDEGPTRLVGYFLLVWIILSFVLSIALNR
ncbi:Chaperone DnaJ-domain superfamily protein [Quillaja saponaria]|uniref:Chaperone DnaJ-domain superfamily protein n=1 Tax=Quillaja saponaria TaxID=32244 RepID=A0AAD7LXY2_QUISA|nr:Chaperone DnaJ-domain superfamily protein [Quillaja saponaria]